MTTLLCFGLGYTAMHYIADQSRFDRTIATVRDSSRAAKLSNAPQLIVVAFDGISQSQDLRAAIGEANNVLVSVPPDASGDIVLRACRSALLKASQLRSVVYLSTIGVYGNHDGAWVDEQSECRSKDEQSLQRLAAERDWRSFGEQSGVPVAILRLAGIYGPDKNTLLRIMRGTARRILKSGQVFNRVHVLDIARAIDAACEHQADGIFNVTDDEPSPPGEPIAFAAQLLGVDTPPETAFDEAKETMSPRALRFFSDVKRATNTKLKAELGVELQFPTYREGLAALHQGLISHK